MILEKSLIILTAIASLQLLFTLFLHIAGEVKITHKHFKTLKKNKLTRIRAYKPSLSVVVIHKNSKADFSSCLDSIYMNGYKIQDVIVIDKSADNLTSSQIRKYRRHNRNVNLHSFRVSSDNKAQNTKIMKLLNNKLMLVIDSDFYLQDSNIINGLEVFRNKDTLAAIPARQLTLNNKLFVALFSLRQLIIRHFMRPFGGSKYKSINSLQRGLIIRTNTFKKLNTVESVSLNVFDILSAFKQTYASKNLVYADQFCIKTNNVFNIKVSLSMMAVSLTYSLLIGIVILQMGVYNVLPIIAVVLGLLGIFTMLAINKKGIILSDKISLILLSPLTIITGFIEPILIFKQYKTINKLR